MDAKMVHMLCESVEAQAKELREASHSIWAHPETGYQETYASALLCKLLKGRGFAVETGLAGMSTAFCAKKGEGPFHILFVAEYDALPRLGHACGHNLFCCSAVGAAASLSQWLTASGIKASVTVVGSPAEEGGCVENGSGKVPLVASGLFDHADLAMIAHADGTNVIERRLCAGANLEVHFTGRAAHAGGAPEKGINALTAGMLTVNNLNALRQQFLPGMTANPVITDSAALPGTIPDDCHMKINVRASSKKDLTGLLQKAKDCCNAAALVTGCNCTMHLCSFPTEDMAPNHAIGMVWKEALEQMHISAVQADSQHYCWDMGNVSHVCPSLGAYMKIGPADLVGHTPEFRMAADSSQAYEAMLNAAKAMAMTAASYIVNAAFRDAVKKEFAALKQGTGEKEQI
ncbi:MAG: peptidase dimerization domain-containing protein [Oscillospiraceae bacterium]|nr:peptidase dimerization domain-containing protein [Oscillospiraceae bacterium]MDD3260783.1 peptidase dimerization domain-containing protein [Oscillospiraceae bacterium]